MRDFKKRYMVKQFGNPRGILGFLVGVAMAIKNRARTDWTLELLNVLPSDRILEIGFGPGVTVQEVAKMATKGFIAGIDHSELMVQQASRRNATAIQEGRIELKHSSANDSLPYPDATFDKACTVNSHFFWKEPVRSFQEIRRVLKPGGSLFVIWQPRWAKTDAQVKESVQTTSEKLTQAGFELTELKFKSLKPVTGIGAIATKPQ